MAVTYANDIYPLFRPQDKACMHGQQIYLGSSEWMCDPAPNFGYADHGNARHVFQRISNDSMPPDGAWPQSRKDIYSSWMNDGFAP
jgi:hypothetical protein